MDALQEPRTHLVWEQAYHTAGSEQFFDALFDFLVASVPIPPGARVLDIGCGKARHSVRLALRGATVVAADFSLDRVRAASEFVAGSEVADRIEVRQEDVTSLSFADGSFDVVLCWGVLMHVRQNERAMGELVRVTRRGGSIIVSEANVFSFDCAASLVTGLTKKALRLGTHPVRLSWGQYGIEYITNPVGGELLIRHSRMRSLRKSFERRGCRLQARIPGQFSELFTRFEGTAGARLIHNFNSVWFRHIKLPYGACGNVLILSREDAP